MNTTAAAKPRRVYRDDPQRLARLIDHLKAEGTDEKKADIAPMFAKRLMRPQRMIVFVAAMLVTLFLMWVFAREKVDVHTVPEKPQSHWEQLSNQQQNRRQFDRGEVGYAPGAANEWYAHSYDFGIAQNDNRNALRTTLYAAGPPLVGALPMCNADRRITETGVPAQKYYRSTAETFDRRLVSFDGSTYLDKVRLEVVIANTMHSYNKPFNESPRWQKSAPFTVTCNSANSNVPSVAVTGGSNSNDVGGYTPTRFGNSTQRSIITDWWGTFSAAIPTHWASYPPAELKFGPDARVSRFHQNVTTYSGTVEAAIPHSLASYGDVGR
jgi:hypothetical protein